MADDETNNNDSQISAMSLQNIPNMFTRMFNGTIDEKANPRGEVWYALLSGYVLGNSLGTNNTLTGKSRFHIGPVYVW